MNYHDLDNFTCAYIECALWSTNDNSNEQGGDPLDDNYGPEDIALETIKQMVDDCADFRGSNKDLLESINDSQAGHDFWLTRNRHGAGFWDRGLGKLGDKLTEAAHAYGNFDLYVGDDGKIYGG